MFPKGVKCKKCGKEIFPKSDWAYKRLSKKGYHFYCSWKCYRSVRKPKREIILPKVGDTIRIITVPGIQEYSRKEGVVEFYDCFGQMHGTWGGWVIIPGEDNYEIIGEKENE